MEKYLSPEEVVQLLPGMTTELLKQMRFRGDSIPYIRVSPRKIVYRESRVVEYLNAKEQTSTRQNGAA